MLSRFQGFLGGCLLAGSLFFSITIQAHYNVTVQTQAEALTIVSAYCASYLDHFSNPVFAPAQCYPVLNEGSGGYAGSYGAHCSLSGNTPSSCGSHWTGHAGNVAAYFYDLTPECDAGISAPSVIWTEGANSSDLCDGQCSYSQVGISVCTAGECYGDLVSNGNPCTQSNEISPPDGCTVEGTTIVCDCLATPDAPFCPGGTQPDADDCIYNSSTGKTTCHGDIPDAPPGSGSDLPTQDDGNTNTSPTGGDGNPDTGGGPGSGYGGGGDINGDGDRDIDCDPRSNPDCAYTGSGQGSGDCATQPSCSGDPVQCAQLYQQWAIMCYEKEYGELGKTGKEYQQEQIDQLNAAKTEFTQRLARNEGINDVENTMTAAASDAGTSLGNIFVGGASCPSAASTLPNGVVFDPPVGDFIGPVRAILTFVVWAWVLFVLWVSFTKTLKAQA
jgi:hypothetical protein